MLEKVYDPAAFAGRLRRLSDMLDNSSRKGRAHTADAKRKFGSAAMLHQLMNSVPEPRDLFRETFSHCLRTNPRSARWIIGQMAFYLHLGPFSRFVIEEIDIKIAQNRCGRAQHGRALDRRARGDVRDRLRTLTCPS